MSSYIIPNIFQVVPFELRALRLCTGKDVMQTLKLTTATTFLISSCLRAFSDLLWFRDLGQTEIWSEVLAFQREAKTQCRVMQVVFVEDNANKSSQVTPKMRDGH